MKRLMLDLAMILCITLLSGSAAIADDAGSGDRATFSVEADGLIQVQTVHESDKTVKNYALASGNRIMETGPFTPDGMQVYTVRSFSLTDNTPEGPIMVYDEAGRAVPLTREIDTVCHAMRDIDHHVLECRILKVGNEWFASAMLNVNLWTPYQFYYFDQESGKLALLYEFANRDVTGVRLLSAEKLHALDQQSIGGWYEPLTPDGLIKEHPEALENAAQMLLRRGDLFDEAAAKSFYHDRKISVSSLTGLPFSYLLHGVTYGSGIFRRSVTYLNADEKAVFQALLELCPPYEIEQVQGAPESGTALIFRFSAFDRAADRQGEWTLIRLSDAPGSAAFGQTVSKLREQYGELTPCEAPGWLFCKTYR